ncbi:hypothetical protein MMC25_002213 [Agyrium rufum]|nr:hypothetical protein [Agyrium rufum]
MVYPKVLAQLPTLANMIDEVSSEVHLPDEDPFIVGSLLRAAATGDLDIVPAYTKILGRTWQATQEEYFDTDMAN